ncbi:MAG TPA: D-glucuronyl C5-epimerase family protein [Solirubrobacteraceae bacterium]|nr:D-glucuronyl C5-epimerase family protein [Solirubrobacteraceae bacterium]
MTFVRRRTARAAAAPLFAALALALPGVARAAPVLFMGPGGHVTTRQDPFVPAAAPTPAPAPSAVRATAASARPPKKRKAPQVTFASQLLKLRNTGAITPGAYATYSSSWNAALASERRLRGTRAAELEAVIDNLHDIAVAGKLTPGRLPVLFQILDNNRQWWTTGPLLNGEQYVEFAGSQLVWEYYPGQGIELQVLATFGKADGLYTAGRSDYAQMEQVLAQMIPLAVNRGGGPTWEYYFHFDGGNPPWTSAMSQGTGIEALTRAYEASHNDSYLQLAHQALALFTAPPPVGVRVPTALGAWYAQYSFTPGTLILNAFLQALIGLYDYAQVSHDPLAQQLFNAGNAEAEAEVPHFDTGAWSLYQPGVEDTLSYHELVTGFLQQLCQRTQAPVYCTTAQHFTSYLTTPPALTLLTQRVAKGKPSSISFRLSKISHVGIVVIGPGGNTVFSTSATFAYGTRSFAIPPLKHKGTYTIHLSATDLAGNFSRTVGTIQVS